MTPEEFRAAAHRLVDWIADYRRDVSHLPVASIVRPGEIAAELPARAPEEAESFEALLADVERIIVPGLTHWQHPSFFGYFPCNGDLSSVLGDFLSTGLGVLGLSWQASPALTELEEVTCDWLRELCGLTPRWRGVIQDTASTSTLVALLCARERASAFSADREGLQGGEAPMTVYVSEQAHSSVLKAALLAGYGRRYVRSIPADERFALRPDLLTEAVNADLQRGFRPAAIVTTTGTTAATGMDPIARAADIAEQHGAWLHVDAAMAGSGMILPELRVHWDGIERADSVVINPHKWLGVAFDCSLYYVRDPQLLVRVMSTSPSYLRSGADAEVHNLRDWGIPLGRRFRALKIWFLLRLEGAAALRARLRRDIENARWLERLVAATPPWRVVAPVLLQTVCVRHEPPGLEGDALDAHTRAWAERVNSSGAAYVTPAVVGDRWAVRVSIGGLATERRHVEALWAQLQRHVVSPAQGTPPADT